MRRRKSSGKGAALLMALLCLGVSAYFCGRILYQEYEYKKGDDAYDRIYDMAVTEKADTNPETKQDDSVEEILSEEVTDGVNDEVTDKVPEENVSVDFSALTEVNKEIKAWLYCPDTVINYPVCQGKDNAYYLRHLADGTYNLNGCLFIDCDNKADFSDDNTIIYGHHMASGRMFASIVGYKNQNYYEAHPVMYLTVGDVEYKAELFAGYITSVGSDAYSLKFPSAHDFAEWLRGVYARSDFHADVHITTDDRIVTFSTCAYDFDNARYVVHGKLTRINE